MAEAFDQKRYEARKGALTRAVNRAERSKSATDYRAVIDLCDATLVYFDQHEDQRPDQWNAWVRARDDAASALARSSSSASWPF